MNNSITNVQKISICPNCHNRVIKQTGNEHHTPAHEIANNVVKCHVTKTSLSVDDLISPESRSAKKQQMHQSYLNRKRAKLKSFNYQFSHTL